MRRFLLVPALLLAVAGPALAQEKKGDKVEQPPGPAPTILAVDRVDEAGGQAVFQRVHTVMVPTQVTEKQMVNGQEVQVARIVYRSQAVFQSVAYPLKGAGFQTAGGKKLAADDALKQMKKGKLVVIVEGGQPIDPAYAKLLNPEALVFQPTLGPAGQVRPGPIPKQLPPQPVDN